MSPITPRAHLTEEDDSDVEHYEQENLSTELRQTGVRLLEELRSKQALMEGLTTRLRQIYTSTPDLSFLASVDFEGLSDSFLSSIPKAGSREVTPSMPPLYVECVERAEKEVARLEELLDAQNGELHAFERDLHAAENMLETEREQFKCDRIKLKKEIIELQAVVKRRDALARERDRLNSHHVASQATIDIPSNDVMVEAELNRLRTNLEDQMKAERVRMTAERERLESQLCQQAVEVDRLNRQLLEMEAVEKERDLLQAMLRDRDEVIRQSRDVVAVTTSQGGCQTEFLWESVQVEINRLHSAVTRYESELNEERDRVEALEAELRMRVVPDKSVGVCTDVVACQSTAVGADVPQRSTDEWTQCNGQKEELAHLQAENVKLKEKYSRYRSEFSAVVEKRRLSVSVGVATDPHLAVDRSTSRTPQIVSECTVQVDDDRDQQLFLVESDNMLLAAERDRTSAELEEAFKEIALLQRRVLKRDEAIAQFQHPMHLTDTHSVATEVDLRDLQLMVPQLASVPPVLVISVEPQVVALQECHSAVTTIEGPATDLVVEAHSAVTTIEEPVTHLEEIHSGVTTIWGPVTHLEEIHSGVTSIEGPATHLVQAHSGVTTIESHPRVFQETHSDVVIVMGQAPLLEEVHSGVVSIDSAPALPRRLQESQSIVTTIDSVADGPRPVRSVVTSGVTAIDSRPRSLVAVHEIAADVLPITPVQATVASLLEELSTCDVGVMACPAMVGESSTGSFQDASSGASVDTSDLSPTSFALRVDEFVQTSSGPENQLIRSLQKRLVMAEQKMKEQVDFFTSELVASSRRRSAGSIQDGSPKHPHSSLDRVKHDLVDFYQLGQPSRPSDGSPGEVEVSSIIAPKATTSMSNAEGATFDFSMSSMQQTVSLLSPLRIPFASPPSGMALRTPAPRDQDGDVLMRTAPRTQFRRPTEDFTIHEDENDGTLFQSVSPSPELAVAVGEMKQRLVSVRSKAKLVQSLNNRLAWISRINASS